MHRRSVLSLLGLGGVGVVTARGLSGCELQGGNSSDSSALPSSLDVKVMDMLMVFVGGSVGITVKVETETAIDGGAKSGGELGLVWGACLLTEPQKVPRLNSELWCCCVNHLPNPEI